MSQEYISRNPFNRKQRTYIKWYVKSALEQRFHQKRKPSTQEMASLAQLFHLEESVIRVWFYNRRHKEKRTSLLLSPMGDTINNRRITNDQTARFAEMLRSRCVMIGQHNGRHVYDFPLIRRISPRTVNHYCFGQSDDTIEQKTVVVLGTKCLGHTKFINNVINYVANVEPRDKFRFQLVDEDELSHTVDCISVYDIHYTQGFRIPYSLKIVVTPYLIDSEDAECFKNEKIAEILHEFIENNEGIQQLHMICNVINKGDTNPSVLSVFAKDVENNLNSWTLTRDFLGDMDSWQDIIQHFFLVLARMKSKSLSLTKLVLQERRNMERKVDGLGSVLTATLVKMGEINMANQTLMHFNQAEMKQVDYLQQCPTMVADLIRQKNCESNLHHHQVYGLCYDVDPTVHDVAMIWQQMNSLNNDLLENGAIMLKNVRSIWRRIRWLNKITLCGNAFFSRKVFNVLFEAEQRLTQFGFSCPNI